MRILVIFTGGTIGSSVNDGYISTDSNKKYLLIEKYKALGKHDIDFEYAEPYTLLSENLTGEYLRKLGECLNNNINKDFDGIIVTHGTDTIQYSSACMTYYLKNLQIPILFVSSNYVLDDPRSNGLENFELAVDFIVNKYMTGVFVVYRNQDGNTYIHNGNRLLPHLPYRDELFSINNSHYGVYKNNKFMLNSYCSYKNYRDNSSIRLELPNTLDSNILRIFPYPGLSYPELTKKTKAIILDSYHSGTICSVTSEMTEFFTSAENMGIPVFIVGIPNENYYESVKEWEKFNIIILPVASPIAMYIKLWMIISSDIVLSNYSIIDIMVQSIANDILEV